MPNLPRNSYLPLLAIIAIALPFCAPLTAQQTVSVTTGKLQGVSANGIVSFKGIPFAAPPIGKLRLRAPQPAAPWQGVRKADHFGATCMQGPNTELGPWTHEFQYVTPASEDCLYINVWTPGAARGANLPVLFYIYGGAFTGGSGDVPVYDGESLAKSGMVVVTFNYRVGALGFLALPQLTAESTHHNSGNYGLLDQIAALKWANQNIAAFGGDPKRITIAGQSAGAMSVNALLASPLTKGLFSAAIADSGIGGRGVPVRLLADAEKTGTAFAASKNAPSLKALRALPATALLPTAGASLPVGPIVDGWVLPDQPATLTTGRGLDNDVPVITGYQEGDSRIARTSATPDTTVAQFEKRARAIYGSMADEFIKLYPASTDDEAKQSEAISGQDRTRAGMYLWASKRTATHESPVFIYYFDRAIPWPAHPEFGAFHSGELPYTFGNLNLFDRPWEPIDYSISAMMMSYWKNMTASGNPNSSATPQWLPVDPAKPAVMRLGATCEPIPPATDVRLDFWRRYYASPESKHAPVF